MPNVTVMNVMGLKLVSNEAKKLTNAAIAISKNMLRTLLRIQYNAAVFPIYLVCGGLKYVYQWSFISDNEDTPLEPKSDVIVGAVKKLRNCVVSGMSGISASRCGTDSIASTSDDQNSFLCEDESSDKISDAVLEEGCSNTESSDKSSQIAFLEASKFTGSDLMWDIPIITAKAKYFAQCLKEGKKEKIVVARKALQQHPINGQAPQTRQEYNKMINKTRNGLEYFVKSSVAKSKDGGESKNACKFNSVENKTASNVPEKRQRVEFCLDESQHFPKSEVSKCLCDPRLKKQGEIMHRKMATINRNLRKIHETCSHFVRGLSTLNEDLAKIISMKEKLASLEFQVDEGRKLLQEVESDRFIMKSKLLALEKLISEEEAFLCDGPCESGFYENENNARTIGEL